MKRLLTIMFMTLLSTTLLLTSCNTGNKDIEEETATIMDSELPAAGDVEELVEDMALGDEVMDENKDDDMAMDKGTDKDSDEEEAGEIEVNLFDRALLESVKFNWPDSYKMVSVEDSNGEITRVTTYQKGYSKREERVSEEETTIEIYNEEEGITYDYVLGETTGIMRKDDEDDVAYLEEDKMMVGQSIMSIFEEDFEEDINIVANKIRFKGRKAIEIEISDANPEEGEESTPWLMIFDSDYTLPLRTEISFGEEWHFTMEFEELEINNRLKDSLFEAPEDITFTEY